MSATSRLVASVVLSCSLALGPVGAAQAATVEPHSSPVYVNKGKGFQPVTMATRVSPGDTIMTKDGGRAELVYDDGCRVRVEPGAVASVKGVSAGAKDGMVEASPCKTAASSAGTGASAPGAAAAPGAAVAGLGAAGAGSAFGVAAIAGISVGMGVSMVRHFNSGNKPISP